MIKIAAFLLPDKNIKKKILYLKKNVKKTFGIQPYLSHPPHCTLFTMDVTKKVLKEKNLRKNLIIKSNFNNKLTISKADVFKNDPITQGKTIYLRIVKTPFLKKLQIKLLKKIFKFNKKQNREKLKFKWMQKNYIKYGYPFVGIKWIPHFTIASLLNVNHEEEFIKKFLKSKIKSRELIKKIHFYKINGNKHIYLWSIGIKLKK